MISKAWIFYNHKNDNQLNKKFNDQLNSFVFNGLSTEEPQKFTAPWPLELQNVVALQFIALQEVQRKLHKTHGFNSAMRCNVSVRSNNKISCCKNATEKRQGCECFRTRKRTVVSILICPLDVFPPTYQNSKKWMMGRLGSWDTCKLQKHLVHWH